MNWPCCSHTIWGDCTDIIQKKQQQQFLLYQKADDIQVILIGLLNVNSFQRDDAAWVQTESKQSKLQSILYQCTLGIMVTEDCTLHYYIQLPLTSFLCMFIVFYFSLWFFLEYSMLCSLSAWIDKTGIWIDTGIFQTEFNFKNDST